MSPLVVLLILGVVAGVISAGVAVAAYFSPERKALRNDTKAIRRELASRGRQLQIARATLTKIGSGDAGHPALEAQLALTEISNVELKELES